MGLGHREKALTGACRLGSDSGGDKTVAELVGAERSSVRKGGGGG